MFWEEIAPVHQPPGVCCPSTGCCVLLLFMVATVTVLFISSGAQRLLGCIFYVWNVTPRKWGGGGCKAQAELILEYKCVNPRLHACLLHRHDILKTWVLDILLSAINNELDGMRVLLWQCQWHRSSSDTFACSLLTPTAFLPSVSVRFL